jgi:hypothetical protein
VGKQGNDEAKQLGWFLETIQSCPFGNAECPIAAGALVALLLATMNDDVALFRLSTGMTELIQTELLLRVHFRTLLVGA